MHLEFAQQQEGFVKKSLTFHGALLAHSSFLFTRLLIAQLYVTCWDKINPSGSW